MGEGSNSHHAVARNQHADCGAHPTRRARNEAITLNPQIHEPVPTDYLSAAHRSLMHFVSLNILRSDCFVPRNDVGAGG